MKLILFHSQLINLTCAECATKLYDIETGQPKTYKSGPERKDTFYFNQPTPCKQGVDCPKESPEKEREHVLSEKNLQTYKLYRRVRAGFRLKLDELLADNFAAIDMVVKSHDRHQQVAMMQLAKR